MLRKYILLILLSTVAGCTSKKSCLENYYNNNISLHNQIQNSLAAFCKQNNTYAYLVRDRSNNASTNLNIYLSDKTGYTTIEFSSTLQRLDQYPDRTAAIKVPVELIENFNKSIYHFVFCENDQVFFGYKADDSQVFARDVYYIGILTPYTESQVAKNSTRINATALITTHYLP